MEIKGGLPFSVGKIKEFLSKNFILVVFCGVGLLLVLFSNLFFPQASSGKKTESVEKAEDIAADYVRQTTDQLKKLISGIKGVGGCEVMMTVESSPQHIYVAEERKNEFQTEEVESGRERREIKKESDEAYIVINDANGQKALIKTTLLPKVKGVVVLCDGADDPDVKLRVIEAVGTIFGISSSRVCVVKKS